MNAAIDFFSTPYIPTTRQQWLQDRLILQRLADISHVISIEYDNRVGRLHILDDADLRRKKIELTKLRKQLSQLEVDLFYKDVVNNDLVIRIGQYADLLYVSDYLAPSFSEEIIAVCALLHSGDAALLHYRALQICVDAERDSSEKLTCIAHDYARLVQQFKRRPHAATWHYIMQHC